MLRNIINGNYPTNVEIISREKFNDKEKQLLNLSGLDDYHCEAWTAIGTNNQLSYSTHGLFRYFGKFPAPIATHLIEKYTDEEDKVVDMMLGSGTTGVECLISNRECQLYDVSDLSVLLAKVKTTYIDRDTLQKTFNFIKENYAPLSIEDYDYEPVGLRDYTHWFYNETVDGLRGIRKLVFSIKDDDVRDFYMIIFLSIVRRVSKATTQQGRMFLDVKTALRNPFPEFEKRTIKAIDLVSKLPNNKSITIKKHNSMDRFPVSQHNKYKLAILHPPYFNSYKYSSINSLELSWLGINHAEVRKNEVREFFKRGLAEKVTDYVDDMYEVIVNGIELLTDDGVMGLMIGDTIIKGQYIRTTKKILDRLEDSNICTVEKVILRKPKYTEASWVASQRRKENQLNITLYDYIILLRKIENV